MAGYSDSGTFGGYAPGNFSNLKKQMGIEDGNLTDQDIKRYYPKSNEPSTLEQNNIVASEPMQQPQGIADLGRHDREVLKPKLEKMQSTKKDYKSMGEALGKLGKQIGSGNYNPTTIDTRELDRIKEEATQKEREIRQRLLDRMSQY